jgi:hypothetical protein
LPADYPRRNLDRTSNLFPFRGHHFTSLEQQLVRNYFSLVDSVLQIRQMLGKGDLRILFTIRLNSMLQEGV